MGWDTWLYAAGGCAGAVVAAVAAFQEKLIYVPNFPTRRTEMQMTPSDMSMPYEEVMVRTHDGVDIQTWFVKQQNAHNRAPTLFFFHGNAGNISHRVSNVHHMHRILGVNVVMVSYRGYGKSTGSPTEKGLIVDAQAVFDHYLDRDDVNKNGVFIFGRSIGGAVGVALAHQNKGRFHGLIVENTFTDMRDMIDVVLKPLSPLKFLCRNTWSSAVRIASVVEPVLFLVGERDELVPPRMSDELINAASKSRDKRVYKVANGTHNDTWFVGGEGYYRAIAGFLKSHVLMRPTDASPSTE